MNIVQRSVLQAGALVVAICLWLPGRAAAQAWVPPAGVGSVSILMQRIDNTGHLLTDGFRIDDGKSLDMTLFVEAEYAVTDRLSVSAGLPFVSAKYIGPGPGPFPEQAVDTCRCWQHGWQDIGLTARYNVSNGVFGLTPSVSFGIPSHDYPYRGEAVIGRNLKELRLAADAGLRLDRISPRLSVQGRYSYAIVEKVIGVPNNRSNATVEGGFLISSKLAARGVLAWQRTHGGLRAGSIPPADLAFPGEVNSEERVAQHDRLLRDNNLHAGAGLSYSLPLVDVFASYLAFVHGTDSHDGHALTVGVSWPFEIGR